MTPASVTCFTMADADNFIGLVAMVASLRIQGYAFPVVVLDLGLTSAQRVALGEETACTVVRRRDITDRHPFLLAPFPFVLGAEGIVGYLDADVIVTRPLGAMLDAAVEGKVCVVADFLVDRWFAEWGPIFGLRAALRRQAYANAGFVAFSTAHFPDLLRRWWECCDALVPTLRMPMPQSDPLALPDQDALNALLMSEVPQDRQLVLPAHAEPMTPRQLSLTKLVGTLRLACAYDGQVTQFLHPVGSPKPWQPQPKQKLYRSGYELCLRRLLATSAPTLRAAETELPGWLRPGLVGDVTLRWLAALTWMRTTKFRVKRALSPLKRRVLERATEPQAGG
jgi:hypothetical protein